MKIYLLAAAAGAAAIASPAFAGADGPYVGIEGGVTLPQTTDLDIILNNTSVTPNTTATYTNGYSVKSNTGYGIDAIAGLKLGYFRLEAEGGYQRGKVKSVTVSTPLLTDVGMATATAVTAANFPVHDHIGVTKLMANALLDSDFGAGGFGGYVGGGAGRAWTSYTGNSDSSWAYQGIAGLRLALTPNLDAGVKYEYFRTGRLSFADAFTVNSTNFTTSARGHFTSNNILASLVYNFNSREAAAEPLPPPPPPPPPPPAAPATQTCPDGSVIDATATCRAPPPPPPPPPPPAQRGERG